MNPVHSLVEHLIELYGEIHPVAEGVIVFIEHYHGHDNPANVGGRLHTVVWDPALWVSGEHNPKVCRHRFFLNQEETLAEFLRNFLRPVNPEKPMELSFKSLRITSIQSEAFVPTLN